MILWLKFYFSNNCWYRTFKTSTVLSKDHLKLSLQLLQQFSLRYSASINRVNKTNWNNNKTKQKNPRLPKPRPPAWVGAPRLTPPSSQPGESRWVRRRKVFSAGLSPEEQQRRLYPTVWCSSITTAAFKLSSGSFEPRRNGSKHGKHVQLHRPREGKREWELKNCNCNWKAPRSNCWIIWAGRTESEFLSE